MPRLAVPALLAAIVLTLTACAPSVSPLFRDYEVRTPGASEEFPADVYSRIRAALNEAGWTETEADAPNIVSTTPRSISSWGLFRTEVSLDVAPIGDRHVRILFHPIRYSFLGGRTKIGYLSRGVRGSILPELNAAFEEQGFDVLGTAAERDMESHSDQESVGLRGRSEVRGKSRPVFRSFEERSGAYVTKKIGEMGRFASTAVDPS